MAMLLSFCVRPAGHNYLTWRCKSSNDPTQRKNLLSAIANHSIISWAHTICWESMISRLKNLKILLEFDHQKMILDPQAYLNRKPGGKVQRNGKPG